MRAFEHKVPLEGEKIVLATDIRAYEKALINSDPTVAETLMDIAAFNMYKCIESKVLPFHRFKEIILLAGKGNNGADAYALGSLLLRDGYEVRAYQIFSQESILCKKKAYLFEREQGEIIYVEDAKAIQFAKDTLVIDGLLGTGFKGEVEGLMGQVIDACNSHRCFVFSIDIASGVDGDSGIVKGRAIYADITAYLGVLKVGHLFEDGYKHAGSLNFIDLGIDLTPLQCENHLANPFILYHNLPKKSKLAHKYTTGEVCIIAGSKGMSGAADLSCRAAFRSGWGVVRHFSFGERSSMKEVMFHPYSKEEVDKELTRAKSILIGPGLGRRAIAKKMVEEILTIESIPMVIDGDALFLMQKAPKNAILTPHRGELMHLLKVEKGASDKQILKMAKIYADTHHVHIIYKGVPTIILSPHKKNIVVVAGNPGMAKSGSGDVLSGIVASLLAQGAEKEEAMAISVMLHGKAADAAAERLSLSYMVASDIIDSLSDIFLDMERKAFLFG